MSVPIAVVYEADADFRIATELADRVLCDAIEYVEPEVLSEYRTWLARVPSGPVLTWSNLSVVARVRGYKAKGHFNGQPGEADAAAARRAIKYLLRSIPGLQGILLVRDQDDQPARRTGLEQARAIETEPIQIIIGLAVVEREAWVISGFEPQGEDEQARLDAERQTLGFYPHERSHQLTACKDDAAPRSPKRVLQVLTGGHYDRERRCWNATPLAVLRERGTENGLVAFLDEVRTRLAR